MAHDASISKGRTYFRYFGYNAELREQARGDTRARRLISPFTIVSGVIGVGLCIALVCIYLQRDSVARGRAIAELARTNAELKHRLAERTIERDNVARDDALAELARTNAELKQRLAERTIERDTIA